MPHTPVSESGLHCLPGRFRREAWRGFVTARHGAMGYGGRTDWPVGHPLCFAGPSPRGATSHAPRCRTEGVHGVVSA